mgnify:CR=1 FL=1
MNKRPLVSIIIPTFKRANYLERCINSALEQSYTNIEILVIDDNNENSVYRKNTELLMKKYLENEKIRYIKHKVNKNGAAARNTGIKNCTGKYITFLDDDDTFEYNRIEKLVAILEDEENKEFAGVYTNIIIKNRKETQELREISICKSGNLKRELLLQRFTVGSGSNMFFKRNILDYLNGFDERFKRHQDWEFLIRFFRENKLYYLDEMLVTKYMDSRINYPNSYTLEEVKNIFLETFNSDIKEYDSETQKIIIFKHELDLIFSYINDLRLKKASKLINKNKEYIEYIHYITMAKIFIKSIIKELLKVLRKNNEEINNKH